MNIPQMFEDPRALGFILVLILIIIVIMLKKTSRGWFQSLGLTPNQLLCARSIELGYTKSRDISQITKLDIDRVTSALRSLVNWGVVDYELSSEAHRGRFEKEYFLTGVPYQ